MFKNCSFPCFYYWRVIKISKASRYVWLVGYTKLLSMAPGIKSISLIPFKTALFSFYCHILFTFQGTFPLPLLCILSFSPPRMESMEWALQIVVKPASWRSTSLVNMQHVKRSQQITLIYKVYSSEALIFVWNHIIIYCKTLHVLLFTFHLQQLNN